MKHISEEHKKFGTVWATHALKGAVYFRALNFLFRWKEGEIKTWVPDRKDQTFRASFARHGKLYILRKGTGLFRLQNDTDIPEFLPGTGIFARARVRVITEHPKEPGDQTLFIGTSVNGCYLYDGHTARPFPTEVDEYLRTNRLNHGIRLTNGNLALATLKGGVAVTDSRGRLTYMFNRASGLKDENVKYLLEDLQGNLWLALNSGIARLEYNSPFSFYDESNHLLGMAASVIHHHKTLYAGTSKGLYVFPPGESRFQAVPGITGNCYALLSMEGSLIASTASGVFEVMEDSVRTVLAVPSRALLHSGRTPGRVWCGTRNGLVSIRQRNSRWEVEHEYGTIDREISSVAEDSNGDLWLGLSSGEVQVVTFTPGINQPEYKQYGTGQGLPGEWARVVAADHVMVATAKGLFRLADNKKQFVPDHTLGPKFAGGGQPVYRIVLDENRHIWFHSKSRNYQAIPGPGGSYSVISSPFLRLETVQVNGIYPAPGGNAVWFASHNGLIRYDATFKKIYSIDFATVIRNIFTNDNRNESLSGYLKKQNEGHRGEGARPILTFDRRNLDFEYSAPFFEEETQTTYRCFLEGYDKGWSKWSKATKRSYTNLNAGEYKFRVRAKNVFEYPSSEARFRFEILPPWFQSWWAYILYIAAAGLGVYSLVRWRIHQLKRKTVKLENLVNQRTQTIRERNREINNKNERLVEQTKQLEEQAEKLQEMDRVKSRFFDNISHEFRTPLTLIMSPLEQMHEDSRDKKQKSRLKTMLRSSQRLLTLINRLLALSRSDNKQLKLQAAQLDIVSFIREFLDQFRLITAKHRIKLEFDTQEKEKEILLYFDRVKMGDVMSNLLGNALKFTPPGGAITVSISLISRVIDEDVPPGKEEMEPQFVKISVRDTGIGIPTDQLPKIFNRFYQAEKPRMEKAPGEGSGIGLAFVKEIVQFHHGIIDAHSREGKGAEFVIRLPLGEKHLKPGEIVHPASAPESQKIKELELLHIYDEEDDEIIEERADKPVEDKGNGGEEQLVVLVVEDDRDIRKYIREPLEKLYKVIEAKDGQEGIDEARKNIPDIIVSDIMMPKVDGFQLCRTLKEDRDTSHIPIILLTARGEEESMLEGLKTGANDYIAKPFNPQNLRMRINNLIALRTRMQFRNQLQELNQRVEIKVPSPDVAFLKELKKTVDENFADSGFNIDVLSKKLFMGRSTLYRKFQALTGQTPNQYLMDYRLEQAELLLRNRSGNVSEIALATGFSSPAYFSTSFKDKYDRSPSSYLAPAPESKSEAKPGTG